MKALQVALEILVAFFALIGVYSLWRLLMGRLFGSDRMVLAIEILSQEEAESAELLIRDAMTHILWLRSEKIVVLTTEELLQNQSFSALLRTYGLEYRILAKEDWEV